MPNQTELITLRDELQIVYKKLGAAHEEFQASHSPVERASIMTLETEMDAIVDELIRIEDGGMPYDPFPPCYIPPYAIGDNDVISQEPQQTNCWPQTSQTLCCRFHPYRTKNGSCQRALNC
jgi:hypothetical protein